MSRASNTSVDADADERVQRTLLALGDPTRRAVLRLLGPGPRRAGELADALQMTPATLSRHLRVLRRCGLIADDEPEEDARVRLYRLQPGGLAPLRGWLDEVESFWGDQLASLQRHARRRVKARP